MLQIDTFTCVKCGRIFIKTHGGIVERPEYAYFSLHPVCDICKIKTVASFFKPRKK